MAKYFILLILYIISGRKRSHKLTNYPKTRDKGVNKGEKGRKNKVGGRKSG